MQHLVVERGHLCVKQIVNVILRILRPGVVFGIPRPAGDSERNACVGLGLAVEPSGPIVEEDRQSLLKHPVVVKVHAIPLIVPGPHSPVVALDAKHFGHSRSECTGDVARHLVLPVQPGVGIGAVYAEGEHIAVVDRHLVRGCAWTLLRHIGQILRPLVLHQEGVVAMACLQGIGNSPHKNIILEVISGCGDRPSTGWHRFSEHMLKERRCIR